MSPKAAQACYSSKSPLPLFAAIRIQGSPGATALSHSTAPLCSDFPSCPHLLPASSSRRLTPCFYRTYCSYSQGRRCRRRRRHHHHHHDHHHNHGLSCFPACWSRKTGSYRCSRWIHNGFFFELDSSLRLWKLLNSSGLRQTLAN